MIWSNKKLVEIAPISHLEDLRKRVKILIVENHEEHFPYKHLQDNGYTIEWWDKITSDKLERMERGEFDIIILDIKDVVDQSISDSDGIGVLKRIKSVNPHQIVVAFSGHSFDLNKTEFWRLADDALSKPVTIIKAKELLDGLIKDKITISNYWNAITRILSNEGLSNRKILKIERKIIKELNGNEPFAKESISKLLIGIQHASAVTTLIQAIIRIWN